LEIFVTGRHSLSTSAMIRTSHPTCPIREHKKPFSSFRIDGITEAAFGRKVFFFPIAFR
jgi:hypothetical protein